MNTEFTKWSLLKEVIWLKQLTDEYIWLSVQTKVQNLGFISMTVTFWVGLINVDCSLIVKAINSLTFT